MTRATMLQPGAKRTGLVGMRPKIVTLELNSSFQGYCDQWHPWQVQT